MSKQAPEPIRVFVGDLHCGSPRGITRKPDNEGQDWLLKTWADFQAHVLHLAKGREFVLMLGGDLVDQPGKPNRDTALDLLLPLAKKASAIYGVPGTEYHVGPDGEEDREIYADLGAALGNVRQSHALSISGRVLWWAHHLNRIGGAPWTEFDGLYRSAKTHNELARLQGMAVPALGIGHHTHRAPGLATYRETRAAVCPAWQLGTAFGAKIRPGSIPTIGGVIWFPEQDRVEIKTYAIPQAHHSA